MIHLQHEGMSNYFLVNFNLDIFTKNIGPMNTLFEESFNDSYSGYLVGLKLFDSYNNKNQITR